MRRRKDEGLALILALMVLAILIILIAQMSISSLQNRTVAQNHLGDLQNSYAARSGYHLATLYLLADLEKEPEADSLHEKWALPQSVPYGASTLRVETKDSARFLNLSLLVDDEGKVDPAMEIRLRKLVRILEQPPDVADRIIDYIDADTRGEYEGRARNERLYNLDELLRIEGMEPEVLYGSKRPGEERKGIMEFLTIWPRVLPEGGSEDAGKVNVNTAPAEVLQSISEEMTLEAALAVVDTTQSVPSARPSRTLGS